MKSLDGNVIPETVYEYKLQDNICKQYEQSRHIFNRNSFKEKQSC